MAVSGHDEDDGSGIDWEFYKELWGMQAFFANPVVALSQVHCRGPLCTPLPAKLNTNDTAQAADWSRLIKGINKVITTFEGQRSVAVVCV